MEISGAELKRLLTADPTKQKFQLIDVRRSDERAEAYIASSIHLELSQLKEKIAEQQLDKECMTITYCRGGGRSKKALHILQEQGFKNCFSLTGGMLAWQADEQLSEDNDTLERYKHHLRLPEIGMTGQKKLLKSHVAIVGAGGLGSPTAYYLTAAGIGKLTIVDDDQVELDNLQRQILHNQQRLGQNKASSAKQTLTQLNSDVEIEAIAERVCEDNIGSLLTTAELIVDASDNFETRYVINKHCHQCDKPFVYGSVQGFYGQVALFHGCPCYACLFPNVPDDDAAPNCQVYGVCGVTPGIIGLMQATEALKWLLQPKQQYNQLITYDAWKNEYKKLTLVADPNCQVCQTRPA